VRAELHSGGPTGAAGGSGLCGGGACGSHRGYCKAAAAAHTLY